MARRPSGADTSIFQALVENSSDAIALLDERGVIRFASRSSERVLGYTPEERADRSAFEFVHEDDVPQLADAFMRCFAHPGMTVTAEFRARHKDGSWRHIEAIAVNRLTEPEIGGVVVNYRDVSARKAAEAALASSEERLRHMFESAPDLIYYCNPSGRFTYVNRTAARVMKYSEGELIGRHFLTLIRQDYQATAAEFYARQLTEGTPNSYLEFPAITKDGQTIWVGQHVQLVKQSAQVTGVQAIARDISRQKDAEDRLRRSEARYRSLIQGAAYGIYRTTMPGKILDANPALAEMLGYQSVEELMTVNITDVYANPSDRTALIARYHEAGNETLSTDVAWRKKDGSPIIVRVTARVVDFEDQGVDTFEAIAEDITAKRALEDQLRQSQKMEAVGRLARGIAHDFNNVLAAILGCSDLMQIRLKPDDPSYEDAMEIGRAAERGAALTRQLLAFSRRQAAVPEVLNVHAVLRSFESMLQRLSGDIAIRIHTPGTPPIVRVEPGQLEQVVMNLIVNARDATPEGGTIDVEADQIVVGPREAIRFPEVPQGRYARIAVRDTGVGIDPEMQRHVFEPFFSTKDPAKGTGLGLSIVYGIAKEAGGTVTFTSALNKGTTFEVLLPLIEG
jgi:two-component system cell cycle sensor histidine kinase/response regulator CckA